MKPKCEFQVDSVLLPGFSYLGPGNPIANGHPVNCVDEVAKEHDIKYDEIQKSFKLHKNKYQAFREIQLADEVFVERIRGLNTKTWSETWGKFVGYIVISGKIFIEKCLNFTLYPRF